jgi:predicted Na+-dependent transporter
MSSTSALNIGTFIGATVDSLAYILIGWAIIRAFYAITKRKYRALPYVIVSVIGGIVSMIVSAAINANADSTATGISTLARVLVVLIAVVIALIIGRANARECQKHKETQISMCYCVTGLHITNRCSCRLKPFLVQTNSVRCGSYGSDSAAQLNSMLYPFRDMHDWGE